MAFERLQRSYFDYEAALMNRLIQNCGRKAGSFAVTNTRLTGLADEPVHMHFCGAATASAVVWCPCRQLAWSSRSFSAESLLTRDYGGYEIIVRGT